LVKILIGCCGFPISRSKYYMTFNCVELQDTFYNPPDVEKMKALMKEAPEGFKFSMKAWQAITHPPNMMTWRRSKFKPPKEAWNRYGYLKPTKENFEAWALIDKAANALSVTYVVIQLPPTFKYSNENVSNVREFLSTIGSTRYRIGIEFRGDWVEHRLELRKLLNDYSNVTHVVDPFRWFPPETNGEYYFRLHGIGGSEVNYRYKYTQDDLLRLNNMLKALHDAKEIYVMFNNVYMKEDALNFIKILKQQ